MELEVGPEEADVIDGMRLSFRRSDIEMINWLGARWLWLFTFGVGLLGFVRVGVRVRGDVDEN